MPRETRAIEGDEVGLLIPPIASGRETLPAQRCLDLYRVMVRSRAMEERMIKMSKSGQGHFWIGGPGEEAFNACLGFLVKKGEGPAFDYLHLHYRNSAALIALGMPVADGLRQMAMTRTDPHSMGRNFASHYAYRPWNVIPVTSVIGVQFVMAPGTALVQKRLGGDSITIVVGGEAGTAEGDFASCLIWSTRPGQELPVLILVTNNGYGISTPADTQHGEKSVVERGKAFGIPGEVVDGNDVVASWHALRRGMEHCRKTRKPYTIEARLSRLHGHSSSSGAVRVEGEPDCIELLGRKLQDVGALDPKTRQRIHDEARAEVEAALEQVLAESMPTADDIHTHTYAPSKVDAVYPEDYTGLPA